MKYQPNIPSELFNKFIENLGYMPEGQPVLVVRDIYTACYLSINNEVTFVSDDPEAISMFINTVIVNPEFGTNDSYIFVKENTDIEWLNTIDRIVKDMTFDVAIMNPPYDGNLHLKILATVAASVDKVINISPVRWLQDPLASQKKSSDYKRFEDTISKKIENLDIYSAKEMQNVFDGTVMNIDLGIYTIGKGGYDYTKVSYNSILEKVFTHQQNLCNIESNKKLGWRVRMPTILGGKSGGSGNRKIGLSGFGKLLYFYNGEKDGKPWYDWYVKNQYSKTTSEITSSILFNSEVECKNFIDSLQNTKFGKYVTHKLITDVHVSNKTVLWMSDYTQPWTDKRFCEHFGITGYIDDEHAEPNSEWEIILKTIEEYK